MKELSIEEKAKRYDEAIALAKDSFNYPSYPGFIRADVVFPELKESEDEKIKKGIIDFLQKHAGYMTPDQYWDFRNRWMPWLEKQGEKPQGKSALEAINEEKVDNANKVEGKLYVKFGIGQWIVWQGKYYKVNYNGCGYELIDQNGLSISLEYSTVDNNAHLFNIQDAKEGDVLIDKSIGRGCPFIFKETKPSNIKTDILNPLAVLGYCGIGGAGFTKGSGWGDTANCIYYPATKEQRDLLFQKMHEAGYEWDADKKELKTIVQEPTEDVNLPEFESYLCLMLQKFRTKGMCTNGEIIDYVEEHSQKLRDILVNTAWSEEDEKRISWVIEHFSQDVDSYYDLINWLKSLKDRYTWKPSEEQVEAIRLARSFVTDDFNEHPTLSEILMELEEQIKKLREG